MQTASGAFATALASPDQRVAQRVVLTLPALDANGNAIPSSYADVSSCVVSLQGDVAVNTLTPEGTLLISGYSARGCTLTLRGPLQQSSGVATVESQTIGWLFNSNDSTSPLYRLPQQRAGMKVVLQEGRWVGGVAPEWVTVFTLTIDTVAWSNFGVTLTLIDGRNSVRGQASLPPVITNSPYNAGLSSQFAIDQLFRYASPKQYLSRPARRANCVLDVGFRDSIWPDLGTLPSRFSQGTPTFIQGVNGSALDNQPLWNILYQPENADGSAASFAPADKMCGRLDSVANAVNGFTVNLGDSLGTYQFFISRNIGTGQIVVFTNSPSGFSAVTSACTVAAGNHTVEWSASWASGSSTVSGTVWLDGVSHTFSFTAANTRPSGENFTLVSVQGPIEALQITKEAAYATGYPFTPTLVLDQSLNPLTALPDVSGDDIWTVVQDVAAAEAAVITIDEVDVAHFINRNTIYGQASTLTLNSSVNLAGLDTLEQRSTVATHVQVPVTPLQIGAPGTVWAASSLLGIEPGTPLVLNVETEDIAVNVATADSGFYPNTGAIPGDTYWQASQTLDGLGPAMLTGVSVSVVQLSAKRLQVTVTNFNSQTAWLVTPTGGYTGTVGQPSLIIGGQPVTSITPAADGSSTSGALIADAQWPPVGVGGAITNQEYGEILLAVAQNDWLQDSDTGNTLANFYLSDLHTPRPLYRNVKMISDPRLQLIDRVTINDHDVSLTSLDALVVGVHFTLGGQGSGDYWTRSLDLRAYWPPGAWVLGVSGMSELGSTAYAY